MPSVSENLRIWSQEWGWERNGDEWSSWWGGTPALWYGALLPRLHPYLPTGAVLEIGPGYGRWTQYLKELCERLVLVDLTPECIERCRTRFAQSPHITYIVNDGSSLAMVPERSVDFVFSFDSLVHAEPEVIGSYLLQLADRLADDGVGFIHHSNAGSLRLINRVSHRVPKPLLGRLIRRGIALNIVAWRDERMSAAIFRRQCDQAGLACISQELVGWEFGRYLLDCFSIFTRAGSRWDRPLRLARNPRFVAQARLMAALYAQRASE